MKAEVALGEQSHKLAGRLQVENERLKARAESGTGGADPEVLAAIRRDAEAAWTSIARLADNVDKLK